MKGYRFRPGWLVSVAAVLVFPALVGLGVWQLDRAQQKIEIRDRHVSRGAMPPVDLNRTAPDPDSDAFRRATARGRYRPALTIYLDNQVVDGVPGYQILTPLALVGGGSNGAPRFVLVDRGWTAWGEARRPLPEVDTEPGIVELAGRLRAPAEDYFTLADPETDPSFNPLWQNLDLQRYRRVTGLDVGPLVLALEAGPSPAGLVRRPAEYGSGWIQRHRAYAAQWFGLAFVLLVLYVVLNLEKRPANQQDHD